MFASIRRHQKWLWIVIMVLVIISFVIYLDPATSSRGGGGGRKAGSDEFGFVNGRPLSREELLEAYQDVRLESRIFSGRWPEEDPATRQLFNADSRLQQRLVVLEKVRDLNIQVSDEAVANWIAGIFRDPKSNGFRVDAYQQFLKQALQPQGVTEADLQRFARRQVAIEYLVKLGGLSGGFVARGDAEAVFRRENEQMTVQIVPFSFSNYLAGVTVTDAALAQFYTNNMARYRTPDRVQVSYVKYDATNFLAQADQFLAQRTNLAAEVQAEYQRRSPDFFKDPAGKVMSPEAAMSKIKEDTRKGLGLAEANKQATSFAQQLFDLFEKQPAQTNNLERVAAALGVQPMVSEPFSQSEGPTGVKVPEEFAELAFGLSLEQPMGPKPIIGEDAVFIIALKKIWPSEVPPLALIRDRVVDDFRRREAIETARREGRTFYNAVTNGLAQHKTFDVICAEAKVQPLLLPPFSLGTRSLRGWDGRVDLGLVKDTAGTLVPGGISEFMPGSDGGLVLQLISKQPVEESVVKAELPAFLTQLRAARERQAFNEWFRTQMESVRLTGLPKFNKSSSTDTN